MDTIKFDKKDTEIIAHRGLSGIETENSLSAFVAAGNRSYTGIETDVHITADGEFVVVHDSDTKRVCDKSIIIEESTLEQVRSLRLKNIYHLGEEEVCINDIREDLIIPTLAEYVGICRKYGKKCILEIKQRITYENIEKLVETLRKLNYFDNVIFISFKLDNLIDIKKIAPDATAQRLIMHYDSEVLDTLNKYNLDLDLWDQVLTKEVIDEVHLNGHKINCWTCDDKEYAEKLADWGIDYITTNILE